ncbi:MAG TPA: LuxR C-terminal-related transcriptional regulator, partial [Thermomicrobiales bacterium]|nr:LuxR C-terminal-related transcriptional regulator [Thermomicrobiales bacterium]
GLALIHWRVLASLQRLYLQAGRREEETVARNSALGLVIDIAEQFDDIEVRELFLANARAQLDGVHPTTITDHPVGSNDIGLTARELEVLRYIVEGRSDREIANTLSVSHRTVGHHVSNILGKLHVSSRTAAVTVAIREGVVRP